MMFTPVFSSPAGFDRFHGADHVDEGGAATGDDSFFHRSPGGVEGVFDAEFLLLQLGFGRSAHFDDRYAAGQFRQALLQLLFIEFGSGFFNLLTDLVDASFDVPLSP